MTDLTGTVSTEDVRDVLNLTEADIADAQLLKMIKRAQVTLELELNKKIAYAQCSQPEKEAITLLAAIHAICFMTGGSAIGLNFSVGDLTSSNSALPNLSVLQTEFERVLSGLKEPYVGSV
jgi:hypothetical protein